MLHNPQTSYIPENCAFFGFFFYKRCIFFLFYLFIYFILFYFILFIYLFFFFCKSHVYQIKTDFENYDHEGIGYKSEALTLMGFTIRLNVKKKKSSP